MGIASGKQSQSLCSQGHAHRSSDDARECDNFHSNRLKESEMLKTANQRFYGGTAANDANVTYSYTPQYSYTSVQKPSSEQESCCTRFWSSIRQLFVWIVSALCCCFTTQGYACASHHNHPTLEECNECNKQSEERQRAAHQRRIGEKMTSGQGRGICG